MNSNPSQVRVRDAVMRRLQDLGIESQSELARRADVSENTIANVLDGRTRPRRRTRETLGDVLGWTDDWLDHLVKGDRPPERDPAPAEADTLAGELELASEAYYNAVPSRELPFTVGVMITKIAASIGLRADLVDEGPHDLMLSVGDEEPLATVEITVLQADKATRDDAWRILGRLVDARQHLDEQGSDALVIGLVLGTPLGWLAETLRRPVNRMFQDGEGIKIVEGDAQLLQLLNSLATGEG